MKLAAIVINWNNTSETLTCLHSLGTWKDLKPVLWVVDNDSTDQGPERIARHFPQVQLIASSVNLGFAGGNNIAIRRILESGADWILLLNNDADLKEDQAAALIQGLQSRPRLGLVGPVIENHQGPAVRWVAGGKDIARSLDSHIYLPHWPLKEDNGARLRRVDYVPGTAVLIRPSLFTLIGCFAEEYFFGGEMADLCERARRSGFDSAVDVQTLASHTLDRSSEIRERLHIYYILRNRFLFINRNRAGQKVRLWLFWMGAGLMMAAAAFTKRQPQRSRVILMALQDALVGRFGNQNQRVLSFSAAKNKRA
jgi:hypothetical protein